MPFPVGVLVLVLVTLLWGTTFVVIKETLTVVPVPLFLALRFTMALAFFVWVPLGRAARRPAMVLGLLSFAGFATQTLGLAVTTASKAAFITGLSVVLTPVVAAAWLRAAVPVRAWMAAFVALGGLGLMTLSGQEVGGVNRGDLWVLVTALAYAVFIVYLGKVAHAAPALALAGWQHLPMAALAWLWAIPHLDALATLPLSAWAGIAYLAAVCTALVAVLQTYAQRVVPAHLAALIFLLEPVFAALFAYLLLGERLGLAGWIGGGLVVLAMALAELKPKRLLRARRARAGD
ncbi:MAG: DMT family transporter [Trueperaceae bacterium]|nr:DMT family transporter [Trueperaceae bacterium]